MNAVMPKNCPACAHEMQVCLLRCPACQTEVQGAFVLDRFTQLAGEHRAFLETFIRCRGNLKDVGAILNISYPTARNRLDGLIDSLDFENKASATTYRLDVLMRLKEGSITAEEALELLQGGKK